MAKCQSACIIRRVCRILSSFSSRVFLYVRARLEHGSSKRAAVYAVIYSPIRWRALCRLVLPYRLRRVDRASMHYCSSRDTDKSIEMRHCLCYRRLRSININAGRMGQATKYDYSRRQTAHDGKPARCGVISRYRSTAIDYRHHDFDEHFACTANYYTATSPIEAIRQ